MRTDSGKTKTFIPPVPVIGYTAAKITGIRSSELSPASGRTGPRELTKHPLASQQPNRPMPAKNPSRVIDPETVAKELAEARIRLCQRKILAQVGGVAEDQIHRLIDNGIS